MSRTIATVKRPAPHDYEADEAARGLTCTCGLLRANSVHDRGEISRHRARLAQIAEANAYHSRRTGER